MHYPASLPGWKLAARLGLPISFVANVRFDAVSCSYWASSADVDGLVVSANT